MCCEINSKLTDDENWQYQFQCPCNVNPEFSDKEIDMKQDENISKLPEEILQNIFKYLDRDSLMKAVLVCRQWNEVVIIAVMWNYKDGDDDNDDNDDNDNDDDGSTL